MDPLFWHPELVTVWDELEALPILPIGEKVDQPTEITVKLLPFQLEGLNWLQKQEESRVLNFNL